MDRDREAFEAFWSGPHLVEPNGPHELAQQAWQAALAYVRGEREGWKNGLEEVGTTDRGYTIFRQVNEVGANRYWSDEIGGGVVAWDTCLVDAGTLRECLRIEEGTVTESSGRRALAEHEGDG